MSSADAETLLSDTRVPSMFEPALTQKQQRLVCETHGLGFYDLTPRLAAWLSTIQSDTGLVTVFSRHTSASLTIQENADPSVLSDLTASLERLAPRNQPYAHHTEGPDDMPAHIRSMLTDASLSIPVAVGEPALGVWQALYLIEHRDNPHRREIIFHYVGTVAGT